MRFRTTAIAAAVTVATGFCAGCNETTTGVGSPSSDVGSSSAAGPSTSGQDGTPVGSLVFDESESGSDGEDVRAYADANPDPLLLGSAEELSAWRIGLPGELPGDASLASAVSLMDDAVAVAASYPRCMETSAVMLHADGEITFEVWIPEEKQNTVCG